MSELTVITGGSRGIGAACALLAAKAGHGVCLSYVSDARAAEGVVAQIVAIGGEARAVKADVASEADIMQLFEEADRMGKVTGLINNAGVVAPSQKVADYTAGRLERMFAVNITGSFLCAREAVRRMAKSAGGKGGAIVNLSSAAAYLGSPGQYVDYAASKAAIDIFTKGLALEVAGEGIRVNAVRPGLIDTDIHASGGEPDRIARLGHTAPLGRAGTAQEVAEAVLWLMSDAASYVTGDCLNVTGGR